MFLFNRAALLNLLEITRAGNRIIGPTQLTRATDDFLMRGRYVGRRGSSAPLRITLAWRGPLLLVCRNSDFLLSRMKPGPRIVALRWAGAGTCRHQVVVYGSTYMHAKTHAHACTREQTPCIYIHIHLHLKLFQRKGTHSSMHFETQSDTQKPIPYIKFRPFWW